MARIIEKVLEPSIVYEKQIFKIKLKIADDKNIVNYSNDFYSSNNQNNLPQYAE